MFYIFCSLKGEKHIAASAKAMAKILKIHTCTVRRRIDKTGFWTKGDAILMTFNEVPKKLTGFRLGHKPLHPFKKPDGLSGM